MREVTGPIIAIALVLCAVFVPIAFISGLTGEFYRQFALTIAFSTVISAFNSLTLSPALAALLLKGHDAPKDCAGARHGQGAGRLLPRLQPRVPSAAPTATATAWAASWRASPARVLVYGGAAGGDRVRASSWCRRALCRSRTSNIWSASRNCRRAPRWTAPKK